MSVIALVWALFRFFAFALLGILWFAKAWDRMKREWAAYFFWLIGSAAAFTASLLAGVAAVAQVLPR